MLPSPEAAYEICQESGRRADQNLQPQNFQHLYRRRLSGDHNRQHFIRGGEENCQQRAQRDDAPCIQAGGRGGKAALRHHAQQAAAQRPQTARFFYQRIGTALQLVLQVFHGKIGQI